jgi:hypothetical protein
LLRKFLKKKKKKIMGDFKPKIHDWLFIGERKTAMPIAA